MIISQAVTYKTNLFIKSLVSVRLAYLYFTLAHSKGQGQGQGPLIISRKRYQIGNTLLLTSIRKLHKAFQFYILKLTNSNGQNQGHAHFDCEFLANGDR